MVGDQRRQRDSVVSRLAVVAQEKKAALAFRLIGRLRPVQSMTITLGAARIGINQQLLHGNDHMV
jgi:hypothetical protein